MLPNKGNSEFLLVLWLCQVCPSGPPWSFFILLPSFKYSCQRLRGCSVCWKSNLYPEHFWPSSSSWDWSRACWHLNMYNLQPSPSSLQIFWIQNSLFKVLPISTTKGHRGNPVSCLNANQTYGNPVLFSGISSLVLTMLLMGFRRYPDQSFLPCIEWC